MIAKPEPIAFASADGRQAHALYYPPTQPRLRGARRRAAAAGRAQPRRPDRRAPRRRSTCRSSTGPAAASPWSTSTTAAAPATAAPTASALDGAVGHRRRRRLRRGRRATWPTRGEVDPARLAIRGGSAGGYTTLCALDLPRRLRGRRQLLRRRRPRGAGRATRTSSSRATSTAWSAPSPRRPSVYRERSPIHHVDRLTLPGDPLPGPGGQGRAAEPGRDDGRRAAAEGPAGRLPRRSRASGTASGAPRRSRRRSRPSCSFYCRVFGFEPEEPLVPLAIENLG